MGEPLFSCACETCRLACTVKPGWFMPGEAEILAGNMNLTLQELFDNHLQVDFWAAGDDSIFVLSPATASGTPGTEFPFEATGRCTFFKEGRCAIHTLGKPFECAALSHDSAEDARHFEVAESWKAHQAQIAALLGREPVAAEPDSGDLFSMLFGMFQRPGT